MPDTMTRRTALSGHIKSGRFGYTADDRGPVAFREIAPLTMIEVAAWDTDATPVATAVEQVLSVAPPPVSGSVVSSDPASVLWLGPNRWLVVAPETPGLLSGLKKAVGENGAVVDQSHSRTVLDLSGPSATALLSKGCSLDFDGPDLPVGQCASSRLGHFAVLLSRKGDQDFRIFLQRSLALSAWEYLSNAAAEYGYTVNA